MRTLLLLHGAPGSGKSTFIREHHLEPYTLCADDFRTMIADPVLDEKGHYCITQKNDHDAWTLLYNAMEKRMQRGDFTIIDATNCSPKMISHYKKYAEQYRYSVFALDFDPGLDEILKRNAEREEYKRVPEDAVKRMYAMFQSVSMQKYCKQISDISEIENYYTADFNEYRRVVIFGDIHGCFTAFQAALAKISVTDTPVLDSDTKYIFAGDLLDRGIENREMFGWIIANAKNKNVTFVTGNHDLHLIDWAFGTFPVDKNGKARMPREFSDHTLHQLAPEAFEAGEDGKIRYYTDKAEAAKSIAREAVRRFVQCCAFTFHGQKYFVCHGGLTALPKMSYIPTIQMIRGVGDYETHVDEAWEKAYTEGRTQEFIQIHGHRKAQDLDENYHGTEHSVSLEGRVEFGGKLLFCEITENGYSVDSVQNTVFRPLDEQDVKHGDGKDTEIKKLANARIPDTKNVVTNRIIRDPNVVVKIQKNHNLMSLNFDRDAFYHSKWNDATMKARGLFVDQTTGVIMLRSYNKFFNLHEMPETSTVQLNKSLVFPLKAYYKANGFLGIMSVIDGEVVLATKSSTSGPYVDMFREIWDGLTESDRTAMAQLAEENHCSLVFEVCHVNDKHIIDFDTNHLWLLDAIPNSYDIGGIDVNEEFSDMIKNSLVITSPNLYKKKLLAEFNTLDEVAAYAKSRHHDRDIEGIVLQDRRGYMFKLKFHYYTVMKKLRSALQYAQREYRSGLAWGRFQDERTVKFIGFFVKKPYDEWKDMHIIDAIKMYESETGTRLMENIKM